ncbi:ABA4-like family protein [Actinokineospora sp. HUAS TT18]|uniref:ABA4-like family protein n=1 Tax=Actinokineospora sp. HUAS TT18 TaxID=3447451 RepID=UPI003F525753
MTSLLFDLAFWVTVPFWALMVFAPRWSWTHRIVSSPWIVLPTLVVWAVLAAPLFPELWSAVTTPSEAKLRAFVEQDGAVALIWAQIIAWDLFIGRWMYLESRRLDIHPLIMGPLLVFTILLSPIGLPVFLVLRASKRA